MPASACLMSPMIYSAVNLFFFMSVLVVDGLYSFTWYGSAGAGHQNDFAAGAAWEPRVADPRGRAYTLLVEYSFW